MGTGRPKSQVCKECSATLRSMNALKRHIVDAHSITEQDYYVKFELNGPAPTCGCGCGGSPKFYGLGKGFTQFCRGHHLYGMRERGEIKYWCQGLDKNDPKFVAMRQACSRSQTEELRLKSSKLMKSHWERGIIVPLTGSASSQWKGGTSSLQQLSRSRTFNAWTRPIMIRDGFACQKCRKQSELCVHHDKERFAEILHKGIAELGEPGQDFERISLFADWVADYHVKNDVSGVTLCEGCHEKEHDLNA